MAQSAILNHTAFELDGRLSELGRLVESVEQFCRAAGLDDEAAFELNLALESQLSQTQCFKATAV